MKTHKKTQVVSLIFIHFIQKKLKFVFNVHKPQYFISHSMS